LFVQVQNRYDTLLRTPEILEGVKYNYKIRSLRAKGDIADIHYATLKEDSFANKYILKKSKFKNTKKVMLNEFDLLVELQTKVGDHYIKYLPIPIEVITKDPGKDEIVYSVFTYRPGYMNLYQLRELYPNGVDPRHMAWIFNRLINILAVSHSLGIINNGVVPEHILISPQDHGLILLGWLHGTRKGERVQTIPTKYKDWYPEELKSKVPPTPSSDIYMAVKTMLYILGLDPQNKDSLGKLPKRIQGFYKSCLLDRATMRTDDTWVLVEDFKEVLEDVFGKPKFVDLVI
jgi:serine/threonine protein kinase